MRPFARARASLSSPHILEVPLYTFLQTVRVPHQPIELHAAASMGILPACMPMSGQCPAAIMKRLCVIVMSTGGVFGVDCHQGVKASALVRHILATVMPGCWSFDRARVTW